MVKNSKRPKVLLIADVPNWIFARHCKEITKRLSDDFEFTIKFDKEGFDESKYDLIYPLTPDQIDRAKIKDPSKYVTAIRSHRSWENLNFGQYIKDLSDNFQIIQTVSKRLYNIFDGFLPNLVLVHNGVDHESFRPSRTRKRRQGKLIIGWAGNSNSAGKGFEEYIKPLEKIPGVKLKICGYDSKNLNKRQMSKFYSSIDAYVCGSYTEGSNNSIIEASFMGLPIVTTPSGSVPEFLKDNKSALIVENSLPNFIKAITLLRDDVDLRATLGKNAKDSALAKFKWDRVALEYKALFAQALKSKDSWKPTYTKLAKEIILKQ